MQISSEDSLGKEAITAGVIGAGLVFGGLCAYQGATWLGGKIVEGYAAIKKKVKE